jgi:hypothetical protein
MERESSKHSPRVDEEMKKEVQSFLQGDPVDSRVQEAREKEGPADGEPTPDAVISIADRMPGGERLTREEVELRHDLARHIEGHIFPADREQIVANARAMHAPQPVIDRLEMLPAGFYDGFPDVWDALHPSEGKRWA